jgi:hypothetical protein
MAESTVGTMKGSSTMARMKALNGMCSFSSNASHSPSANLTTLAMNVYRKVFHTASRKTLSVTSHW